MDQIEETLKYREDQLNKVTNLMDGILGVAKDMKIEVNKHEEKLDLAGKDMEEAEANVKKGNEQLA